ncbi:MAG: hypothetical protein COA63_008150 [Methylophaga sp.]|nr:hypothetical protein [Methylophaga sp.]
MSYLIQVRNLLLLSLLFFINPSVIIADESCQYDVLGLKLGMTQIQVRDVMLEQGFREQESRRGNMKFTNTEIWPPEGVKLSQEQIRVAAMMQNPNRKAYYEKKAETDADFKQLLTGIPPIPAREDSISVTISTAHKANKDARVYLISSRYLFHSDPNDTKQEYSSDHSVLRNTKWQIYCNGIDVSQLPNKWLSEKIGTQFRSCKNDPEKQSVPFQILIHPQSNKDKQGCRYKFTSGFKEANESLR